MREKFHHHINAVLQSHKAANYSYESSDWTPAIRDRIKTASSCRLQRSDYFWSLPTGLY